MDRLPFRARQETLALPARLIPIHPQVLCPDGRKRSFFQYAKQTELQKGRVQGYVLIQERSLGYSQYRVPGYVPDEENPETFTPFGREFVFQELKERRQVLKETGFNTWLEYRAHLERIEAFKQLGPPTSS